MLYFKKISLLLTIHFFMFGHAPVFAQNKDSTVNKNGKKNNIFQFALKAIKRNTQDSADQSTILNYNSTEPFLPYEGKGIRKIIIEKYGFEKSFGDTSAITSSRGIRLLNRLHRTTKDWVIRDNLFIKEKQSLNANMVADNERYLRTLDFILDARILVKPVADEPDSVDLIVVTKDLFSVTGDLYDLSPSRFKARIGDVNTAGMGQEVFATMLLDKDRDPGFGYTLTYSKTNIRNSFINGSITYSNINPDLTSRSETEHAYWLNLERPLYSQYSHVAGGIIVGHNTSYNVYKKPDSLFYKYSYNTFDAWVGYNLGAKKLLHDASILNRHFISIRYLNNHFTQSPYQARDKYNFRYDDKTALLAQYTFFRQQYYRTNYIYGFGITEDVPYGYNIALTTGWFKQANLGRAYAGLDATHYVYTDKGDFFQYFFRAGTFFNHGVSDANMLIGSGMFSRLFLVRHIKLRQYVNISFARQFKRLSLDPLSINNSFGLRYFSSDSALGNQRISLYSETFSFLTYKLLGFKFAPFAFGNITILTPDNKIFGKSDAYYGLGGGLRTHNENFVFGTTELRFVYFPRAIDQNSFKIELTGNIRFRFNSSYIKAPDIVQLNSDAARNIY